MAWSRSYIYPLAIVLITSAIVFISFYYPGTVVDPVANTLYNWIQVMGVVMIWIGGINILRNNYREITTKAPGRWPLAFFQLFLIAAMLISGFGEGSTSTQTGPQADPTLIMWLYNNYMIIGSQAVSALTGLWAVTAVYRAFRARTIESGLFLLGAAFVMLRNAPVGGMIWGGFPIIGNWLIDVIYNPVIRGLVLIMSVGIFTYAVRFYLGRERSAWGQVD
jgi:hypothetical protein